MIESTEHGGYPVLEHLRLIAGGPVVWAPAVEGAVVLSQRGDDFELVVGQDLSIGYTDHDSESVGLYLEESLTFRAASPEAAVWLAYADQLPKPALPPPPDVGRAKLSPHRKGSTPNDVIVSTAHAAR